METACSTGHVALHNRLLWMAAPRIVPEPAARLGARQWLARDGRFEKRQECRDWLRQNVVPARRLSQRREVPMLYAILAYHVEAHVMSWTPEEDAALMADLHEVHDRLKQDGRLGPAARLGATKKARTLRGPGAGLIRRPVRRDQGTAIGLLRGGLRHRRRRHRGGPRAAPRQSQRGLRDPSHLALSSRRAVPGDGGCERGRSDRLPGRDSGCWQLNRASAYLGGLRSAVARSRISIYQSRLFAKA